MDGQEISRKKIHFLLDVTIIYLFVNQASKSIGSGIRSNQSSSINTQPTHFCTPAKRCRAFMNNQCDPPIMNDRYSTKT